MTTFRLLFMSLATVLLSVGCFGSEVGTLRADPTKIRSRLLQSTPIGTSFEEVEAWVLRTQKLKPTVSMTAGFFKQEATGDSTVGVQSIRVTLGDYLSFPFLRTTVVAFWGFDAHGRLIDVWIWKTRDGL